MEAVKVTRKQLAERIQLGCDLTDNERFAIDVLRRSIQADKTVKKMSLIGNAIYHFKTRICRN